jgi:hypothetical protein
MWEERSRDVGGLEGSRFVGREGTISVSICRHSQFTMEGPSIGGVNSCSTWRVGECLMSERCHDVGNGSILLRLH